MRSLMQFNPALGNSSFRRDGFLDAIGGAEHSIPGPVDIYEAEYNEGVSIGREALLRAAPELLDCLVQLLKLHIAHHNDPIHARARKAIDSI
jgi:hypothetical protein